MSSSSVLVRAGGPKQIATLKNQKQAELKSLATIAPDLPDVQLLRFALAFPTKAEAETALNTAVTWRKGEGRSIVESAAAAVEAATAGGGWDNDAVRAAAPHAAVLNSYITPKNILTVSTDDGDLVYIIRASSINDKEMMSKVSVAQVSEFFAYVKEVHSLVANARSEQTGRLCEVIFANDISGIRKPPDKKFSEALTSSSKQYESLYPSLAGPTMILNLPFILQAFIGLFKPLFPKTVQAKLRFERAPVLASLKELTPLTTDVQSRSRFLSEVAKLLN